VADTTLDTIEQPMLILLRGLLFALAGVFLICIVTIVCAPVSIMFSKARRSRSDLEIQKSAPVLAAQFASKVAKKTWVIALAVGVAYIVAYELTGKQ
jgi:hypothetical protein